MSATELPGHELVSAGLEDLRLGRETIASLIISIGAPRLRRLGVAIPHAYADAEHRLYALLAASGVDTAHSRWNALVRRLVSYERAAECAS